MKIVFLCGYPFEENRLGVSEHVYQLTKALGSGKHPVYCHIISMHNETTTIQVHPNVFVHTIAKKLKYYLWPFKAAEVLGLMVKSIKPDIIHLHGTSFPYTLTAVKLSKEIPTLVTIHGDVIEEAYYKKGLRKLWGKFVSGTLMKYVINNLETIIVCSQEMKKRLTSIKKLEYLLFQMVLIFSHIIKVIQRTINKSSHMYSISEDLRRLKGVDILLRSLPLVYERTGPVPVYIAGDGAEYKDLVALVHQARLEPFVHFLGFVSGKDKLTLIQQASIAVVPSRYEPFGIVILELLACCVPIVASRIGGIPEIIQDRKSGLLFDKENVNQLADNITILIQTPELRTLYSKEGLKISETIHMVCYCRENTYFVS